MNLDVTILNSNQIFGNNALSIFNKIGTKAAISDLAILMGGYYNNIVINADNNSKNGFWWISGIDNNNAIAINAYGSIDYYSKFIHKGGCRPVLPYSKICKYITDKKIDKDGIVKVCFGLWPDSSPDKYIQNMLESLYQKDCLKKVNLKFPINIINYGSNDDLIWESNVFEYFGKMYIRVKNNSCFDTSLLSNGEKYKKGNYVWIDVKPITWIVDKKNDIAITEKIIISGVSFDKFNSYNDNFENTNLYRYLKLFFLPTLTQNIDLNIVKMNYIDDMITMLLKQGISKEEIIDRINSLIVKDNVKQKIIEKKS